MNSMIDLFGMQTSAPKGAQIGLATVGAKYADGVSLIFPGQTAATAKHYKCNTAITLAAGDRVVTARVSGSVVVICKIGNPA